MKREKKKRKGRGTGTERKGTGRGRDGGVGKTTIMEGLETGKVQLFVKSVKKWVETLLEVSLVNTVSSRPVRFTY